MEVRVDLLHRKLFLAGPGTFVHRNVMNRFPQNYGWSQYRRGWAGRN